MTPKQTALSIFFGSAILFSSIAIGFVWWDRGAFPGLKPEIFDVEVLEINRNHRGVRLHGMVRHDVKIKQRDQTSNTIAYVYPMMPMNDMNSTMIHVMIRTHVAPDSMAMIEERTIEGLARPPGRALGKDVIEAWRAKGYEFAPKFVLVDEFEDEDSE